jgi:hypothetical protein
MKNKIKNYGLEINSTIENLDNTHFLSGSTSKLGTDIILPGGDWSPYIPKFEPQYTNGYDTYGCTVFGTINAIETLMKKQYGKEYDFSERFTYILAGIRPPGGDPHKVAEVIRSRGLIPQSRLPLPNSFEEFIKPDPMTKEFIDEGDKFLEEQGIGHEWIFTNNPDTKDRISMLKWALERGTVCIAVTAWYEDENGIYIDGGQRNTHWVQLKNIEEKDGKFYLIVNDTYDLVLNGVSTASTKRLHPEHRIFMAKRYAIYPKVKVTENPEEIEKKRNAFIEAIRQILIKIGWIQAEINKIKEERAINTPAIAPIIATTPFPEPVVPKSLIKQFCVAIRDYEGKPGDLNYQNNNPGNCVYSKVGYDPKYGNVKKRGRFAVFPTMELGMLYLENLVKQKAKENPSWSIYDYFAKLHAPTSDNNDPVKYSKYVAFRIGVPVTTKLKDLL